MVGVHLRDGSLKVQTADTHRGRGTWMLYWLCNADKIKKSFKILRRHIKPLTVEDLRNGKDTGICIAISGLKEDMSTLYVHHAGDVTLYITSNNTKTFQSFDDFVDWFWVNKGES